MPIAEIFFFAKCKEWYLNFISQQLATLEIKAYTDFI